MNLTIRQFVAEDKSEYIRLSREFYQSSAVEHSVPEENFHHTFRQCMDGSPYAEGFAFIKGSSFAGYALASITWSNEMGGIYVWLEEAYILPEFQGMGICSAFFEYAEERYRGRAKRFRLEIMPANENAARLYRRMGYKELGYRQMVKDV